MRSHDTSPNDSRNNKGKDKHLIQSKRVYLELFKQPMTMKEVSVLVGIDRANTCRYLGKFRKSESVAYLKKVICSITNHRAWQITANPELFPKQGIQLDLFGNENVGLC